MGCQNALKQMDDEKVELDSDSIEKNFDRFRRLLQKHPVELSPFQSLIDVVLESQDHYRINWLGSKLHTIYSGKENDILPGSWEDEVDLIDICETVAR
jgi:hypothetical protein